MPEEKITVGMTSFTKRADILPEAIDSLSQQCDEIRLWLNSYIPTIRQVIEAGRGKVKLYPENVDHFNGGDYTLNLSGAGKFAELPYSGIYLACDDDIYYPQDYVKTLVYYLDKLGGVVGVHGRVLKSRFRKDMIESTEKGLNFFDACDHVTRVDIVGTGTCCFRCEDFHFQIRDWKYLNFSDLIVALETQRQGIKQHVIPRPNNWLKEIKAAKDSWDHCLFAKNFGSADEEHLIRAILRGKNEIS